MTEDESKKKWCPMTRWFAGAGGKTWTNLPSWTRLANGEENKGQSDRCIGSDCMMWQWTDARKIHGYCGLAND